MRWLQRNTVRAPRPESLSLRTDFLVTRFFLVMLAAYAFKALRINRLTTKEGSISGSCEMQLAT